MILSATTIQSVSLPDRNLIVVLGDDASIWYTVQQTDEMPTQWLPLRSANRSGFTQIAVVAHPSGGVLIAALSAELTLWWQTADAALQTWSGWDSLSSPNAEGGLTNLVAAVDTQGAYAAVTIGLDGAPWLIRQTAAGSETWGEWASPNVPTQTPALIDVDLAPSADGFSIIGLGLDNALYEIETKPDGQWGTWKSVGLPAGTQGLYQMTLITQPDQTTLFTTSLDADLWAITKNGGWQQWIAPGEAGAKGLNVDLVLDSSGLIHAFCIGDDKTVLHLSQTRNGWGAWEHLAPSNIEFTSVSAVMSRTSQSLFAFALDSSGGMWGASGAPNAAWSQWQPITLPEKEVMRGIDDFFANPPVDFEPPDPSLRYDQAAYLVSHNAYASRAYNYLYSQQALSVKGQLERGVRGLMLDIFENCTGTDGAVLAHRSCEITKHMKSSPCETLTMILREVKEFMDANPDAVITLLCESYVGTPDSVRAAITEAGLNPYLFHPNRPNETHKQAWSVKEHGWPTLRWMIENNRRLVIFSQRPQGGDDGLPTQWDYCVETTYGKLSMGRGCDCRTESLPLSDGTRPIFVMNRFPTLSLTGSLLPAAYASLNNADKIMEKITECATAARRLPNFLSVDFVEQGLKGGPIKAINELNRRWLIHVESLAQKSSA